MNPRVLILVAGVSMGACDGGTNTVSSKCNHLDELTFDSFFIQNNMWGRDGATGYEQCVQLASPGPFPIGWHWSWPTGTVDQVRGYPFIGFGQDPWRPTSTTPSLPRLARDLTVLSVDYAIQSTKTGKSNLAFDIWVTREPGVGSPPESNITREIMIWLEYSENPLPPSWLIGEVTIDGEAYDYYRGQAEMTAGYVRDYLAFLKKVPELEGSTAIDAFVRHLVDNGHVLPDEHIRNVFLGNEIWHGTGETTIQSYSVRTE